MSLDFESNAPPIGSEDELVDWFADGEKTSGRLGVGVEHEKLPYRNADFGPVTYGEGIGPFLKGMSRFGWEPIGGNAVVALKRGAESITLEPGGQVELAGAVHHSLVDARDEMRRHLDECDEVSQELGFGFAWLGLRPRGMGSEMPLMPKERYRRMSAYLPRQGRRALDMMFLSATVQANFDYTSESDMVAKMRTAMLVSPIVAALSANSPYRHGRWDGYRSSRYAAWREVDPDRCGLLPFVFDEDFGYRRYLDYALDVPMLFVKREGRFVDLGGRTFRSFLREGHDGHRPNVSDFETHLSLMFPEVRLKRFIEVRSADCVPPAYAIAAIALWKGILYDEESLTASYALLNPLRGSRLQALQYRVAQDGLNAREGEFRVLDIARELLALASKGLERVDPQASQAGLLKPLEELVVRRSTLADDLLTKYGEVPDDAAIASLLRRAPS